MTKKKASKRITQPKKKTKDPHAGRYVYKYKRPALTVDGVVFGIAPEGLKILLIKRGNPREPYYRQWALPGGFVDDMSESLDAAIERELKEETHVSNLFLEQLYTFGAPNRDPRERVVSVAYYALVKSSDLDPEGGSDADDAQWFLVNELPVLAFDHAEIIRVGLERLRSKVRYQPIGFELLPREFTLVQLQELYETILGKELDKRNFRKKISKLGVLTPLETFDRSRLRPARLYQFDRKSYKTLLASGCNFEI